MERMDGVFGEVDGVGVWREEHEGLGVVVRGKDEEGEQEAGEVRIEKVGERRLKL